jgi:hypothetical protein
MTISSKFLDMISDNKYLESRLAGAVFAYYVRSLNAIDHAELSFKVSGRHGNTKVLEDMVKLADRLNSGWCMSECVDDFGKQYGKQAEAVVRTFYKDILALIAGK